MLRKYHLTEVKGDIFQINITPSTGGEEMVKLDPIERIIQIILASGKLKDEKPLSMILIAPIEAGKTSAIRKTCLKAEPALYLTDATAFGIIRVSNGLRDFRDRYTHLVIPDLLNCLAHKRDTVRTLIHFLNALIEEGVVNISTYATNLTGTVEVRAGIITAVPQKIFFDKRRGWENIGFLSRALPVSFDYSIATRVEVFRYIEKQEHLRESIQKLKLPKTRKLINLPFDVAQKIEPYALALAASHFQHQRVYGFRYQRQLQAFAKAIALLEGKNIVDDDCIKELSRLADFINLNFNKL